jgi:glutamine synthetase
MSTILEYVWIDGNEKLRSKIKVVNEVYLDVSGIINSKTYYWNFDGSSTNQSTTEYSDLLLKPVYACINPFFKDRKAFLVLCDVWINDNTPHPTNTHIQLQKYYDDDSVNNKEPWFGIEQEYFIIESNILTQYNSRPYRWNNITPPYGTKQGPYYCSVGSKNALGREIAEEHMLMCLNAGLKVCGMNAEVAPSQWEFQVGICTHFEIGHNLWMARYILERVAENYGCMIDYSPKLMNEYNGSGCHTNFSTTLTRGDNGLEEIKKAIIKLSLNHKEHMKVYGKDNEKRLIGIHETSSYEKFNYGDCDRSSSIRIPISVVNEQRGYFEDRRPAANMDPYLVCAKLIETVIEK